MRVPDGLRAASLLLNINRNLDRVSLWENRIASGQRFTRPSEDPAGFSSALSLSHAISLQQQCQENVYDGLSWLEASEASVQELQDVIGEAKLLVLEAAGSITSASSRHALGDQVNQSLESLLVSANSRLGELYLLGGTEVSRPPFTATRDAEGNITQVQFQGNSSAISRLLDPATGALRVNLNGAEICFEQTCSFTGTTAIADPAAVLGTELATATAGTLFINGLEINFDPATDSLVTLAANINLATGEVAASINAGKLLLTSTTSSGVLELAHGTSNVLAELGLLDASGAVVADQTSAHNLFSTLLEARDLLWGWDGIGLAPFSTPTARLTSPNSSFIEAASGQVDEAYSGEHQLRITSINFGVATVTSSSSLVTGATNLEMQSAGSLQFSLDAAGAIVAGSVSYEQAIYGGRDLSATEQAAIDTLNLGGVSLANNTFTALGLDLQLLGPVAAGDVTIAVAPTELTVEDVFIHPGGRQDSPVNFILTANETQTVSGGPLDKALLTIGDASVNQTASVVTESLAGQLDGHLDLLDSRLASTGGLYQMFSDRAGFLESGLLNLQSALSEAEDLDVIEASVQLKLAQNAYEAALAAASQAFNHSLLDYL